MKCMRSVRAACLLLLPFLIPNFAPFAYSVNLPLQIATLDASIGREARLRASPREGPECAPKPPFDYEHK
jgi:hypothetical protein